jgi:hypothetical protein
MEPVMMGLELPHATGIEGVGKGQWMLAVLRVARWSFLLGWRTKFFWVLNLIVLCLSLSLDRINYFDFEGDGWLSSQFLVSGLMLSVAVSSIAFQAQIMIPYRKRNGQSLVSASPTSLLQFSLGFLVGCTALHLFWLGVQVGLYGLAVQEAWGSRGGFRLLAAGGIIPKVILLSSCHFCIACHCSTTWGLIGMVGAYLAGQGSELVYRGAPDFCQPLVDVLYGVLPDMSPLGFYDLQRMGVPWGLWVLAALQTALYVALMVGLAAWGLRTLSRER